MAVQMLDDEKCPKCGVPVWWAYSEDNSISFELDHIDCYACAHQKQEEEGIKKETPGRTNFVRPVPEAGFDSLPTRADFVQQQIKKAERMAKEKAEKDE